MCGAYFGYFGFMASIYTSRSFGQKSFSKNYFKFILLDVHWETKDGDISSYGKTY